MKQSKFLTVMACLDEQSQIILHKMQNKITEKGLVGTHTQDVPFHISLGSFPVTEADRLKTEMKRVADAFGQFTVELHCLNDFNNRVLFLQPAVNENIDKLHNAFDGNFSDGFPFHAHVTLFCGDERSVIEARRVVGELSQPLTVTVTSLLLGEFFPTKLTAEYRLSNSKPL